MPTLLATYCSLFFVNDTATTEIYTLSLHDALPIWTGPTSARSAGRPGPVPRTRRPAASRPDRKSTRLHSSHPSNSYAVFCLKKKKRQTSLHYMLCEIAYHGLPRPQFRSCRSSCRPLKRVVAESNAFDKSCSCDCFFF